MTARGKRRRLMALLAAAAGAVVFALSPLFPFVRSLAVMSVYSKLHERHSLLAQEHIGLRMPGGLSTPAADWYPFPMTFVADELYAAASGRPDARLTIVYNFPAFDYARGCSRLYDPASPYYSSFYGAYLVRDGRSAALAAGTPDEAAVAEIAAFDFFTLVLGDFGLAPEDRVFDFTVTDRAYGVSCAGYDGWARIQARLTVNGSAHNRRDAVRSYLQYGAPNFGPVAEEFAPVELYGIVCGRYFPQWDVEIYFYVMGADAQICLDCEAQILLNSTLEALP